MALCVRGSMLLLFQIFLNSKKFYFRLNFPLWFLAYHVVVALYERQPYLRYEIVNEMDVERQPNDPDFIPRVWIEYNGSFSFEQSDFFFTDSLPHLPCSNKVSPATAKHWCESSKSWRHVVIISYDNCRCISCSILVTPVLGLLYKKYRKKDICKEKWSFIYAN